jgi:hypothetical protein
MGKKGGRIPPNINSKKSEKMSVKEEFKGKPNYYLGKYKGIEAADVIADFQPTSYNLGTALTYLLRAGKKKYVNNNAIESAIADMTKAKNHLDFEIERLELEMEARANK